MPCSAVTMDQTGMGEKPVEDARRRYGELRVEGVLFTMNNKLTMATQGKEHFQDRKLRIPQGNSALRADLHKLKRVTSATGAPRFVADSDSTGHADRTWAGFLAINASGGEQVIIDYRSAGKRAETRQLEHFAPGSGGQITSRGWGTVGGNNPLEDY